MRLLALVVLCVLAACSSASPTPEADDPTPTPGRYTDAEQAEILAESIGIVYCDTEPSPEWCPAYVSVEVEDRWAYITTTLSADEVAVAESMCPDVASVTYDDDAEPIGVTDVLIFGAGGEDLADCDVVPL